MRNAGCCEKGDEDMCIDHETCGFAVIGCGMISRFHMEAIQSLDDAVLVGVYDQNQEAAENTAREHGVRCFQSFEEAVNDPAVDAVCICTPSYLHAPMACEAVKAGKAVLVEKPLALNLKDCDRLIELAKEKDVPVGVISQLRFSPAIGRVKKALDEGLLGRLTRADLYMKYYRTQEYYDTGGWRGTIEKDGGGALMNQGIHGVDLLRYLAGPVKSIYALSATRVHDIEVEDTLTAALAFQNGAFGVIEASTCDWPGAPRRLELNGEYGVIILEEDRITKWEVEGEKNFSLYEQEPSRVEAFQDPSKISAYGHTCQIRNFVSALKGEAELMIDATEGRKTLEIILGAYASAQSGEPVKISNDWGNVI